MMFNTRSQRAGYIIPLTFLLITLFIFIVLYLTTRGMVYSSFTKTMEDREKARQLAYSGIQIAISQLAHAGDTEQKETVEKPFPGRAASAPAQETSDVKLFKNIVPLLYTKQEFKLKRSVEGVDGTIAVVISSEDGKINLNRIYDFKKHKFLGEGQPKGDMKKMMEQLFARIKEQIGADLFTEFAAFMKKRSYLLNDVTELLTIKGFEVFKDVVFYEPPLKEQKKVVYLTDIFTIWSHHATVEPWLFSSSLQQIWGLKKTDTAIDELLKSFKQTRTLPADGKMLFKSVYDADYALWGQQFEPLLSTSVAADIFSVLASGTVGAATVRFFAILEREKTSSSKATGVTVNLLKIYSI